MSTRLQITEPTPTAKKITGIAGIAGIDLGTTHSLIACFIDEKLTLLPDESGEILLPSVVYFEKNQVHVGQSALGFLNKHPDTVFCSIKRFIGQTVEQVETSGSPYQLAPQGSQLSFYSLQGSQSVLDICSHILKTLAKRFKRCTGNSLRHIVITAPAHFNHLQRRQVQLAAKKAGLEVLRLINEPTAAAIAYGLDQNQSTENQYLVFDLGGGTFDVTLLAQQGSNFLVGATGGDNHLGGDDFDQLIVDYLLTPLGLEKSHLPDHMHSQLLQKARIAKMQLSAQSSVNIELTHPNTQAPHTFSITQSQFEQMAKPLLLKMKNICLRLLNDGKKTTDQIEKIILVGGASRMICVQNMVAHFFNKTPTSDANPDTAIAKGAAIYARKLRDQQADFLLVDVNPLSLGIETMGGLVEKIIHRNTAIPAKTVKQFTTFKDNQTGIVIHIVQGERELVSDCQSLGQFVLKSLPPMRAGQIKIDVTFDIDVSGVLSVHAKVKDHTIEASIQIDAMSNLETPKVIEMIDNADTNSSEDAKNRQLAEQKLSAQKMLTDTQTMLDRYPKMAKNNGYLLVKQAKQALVKAIACENTKAIEQYIKALNDATQGFAKHLTDQAAQKGHSFNKKTEPNQPT